MADDDFDDDLDFDDVDSDDFDDFDTGDGQSLRDLWTNSPLVKIGIVAVVLVFVIGGIFLISGGSGEKNTSRVGGAPEEREVFGSGEEVSPVYKEAIEQQNKEKVEEALRTGTGSVLPTIVETDTGRALESLNQREEEETDPFEQWRIQEFEREVEQQKEEIQREQEQFVESFDQAVQAQPDPQAVADLSDAMLAQMRAILGTLQIPPSNLVTITQPQVMTASGQQDQTFDGVITNQNGQPIDPNAVVQEDAPTVISAGTVLYSQLLTEANSDVPSPVLAQVLDGKWVGARLIGEFERSNKFITMRFTRMSYKDKTYAIQGVALDPNTSLGGLRTDYNPRYMSRVVLPAAAEFVEGIGRAVARSSSTNVNTVGGTTTATEEDLDIEQEIGAGIEEGAREIGDILDEEAGQIEPLVVVAAGTPLALFLTEDVLEDGQLPLRAQPAIPGATGAPTGTPVSPSQSVGQPANPTASQVNQFLNSP